MQNWFRGRTLPVPRSDLFRIGRDDLGIGGLSYSYEVAPGEYRLFAIAVARRLRGGNRHVGREVLDETLDRLADRADASQLSLMTVSALVHRKNAASKALLESFGFHHSFDSRDDYEQWWTTIDTS